MTSSVLQMLASTQLRGTTAEVGISERAEISSANFATQSIITSHPQFTFLSPFIPNSPQPKF